MFLACFFNHVFMIGTINGTGYGNISGTTALMRVFCLAFYSFVLFYLCVCTVVDSCILIIHLINIVLVTVTRTQSTEPPTSSPGGGWRVSCR
jgi:hypothetical protein